MGSRGGIVNTPVSRQLVGFLAVFTAALSVALPGEAAVPGAPAARQTQCQSQVHERAHRVHALGVLLRAAGRHDDRGAFAQGPRGSLHFLYGYAGQPLDSGRPVLSDNLSDSVESTGPVG